MTLLRNAEYIFNYYFWCIIDIFYCNISMQKMQNVSENFFFAFFMIFRFSYIDFLEMCLWVLS